MRILDKLGIAGRVNRLPVNPSSVNTNLLPMLPGPIHFEPHRGTIDPELGVDTVNSRRTKLDQAITNLKNTQFTDQQLIALGSDTIQATNTITALRSGLDRLSRGK